MTATLPITTIRKESTGKTPLRSIVLHPMRGVCTPCTAMFLNGVVTGTVERIMTNVKQKVR